MERTRATAIRLQSLREAPHEHNRSVGTHVRGELAPSKHLYPSVLSIIYDLLIKVGWRGVARSDCDLQCIIIYYLLYYRSIHTSVCIVVWALLCTLYANSHLHAVCRPATDANFANLSVDIEAAICALRINFPLSLLLLLATVSPPFGAVRHSS